MTGPTALNLSSRDRGGTGISMYGLEWVSRCGAEGVGLSVLSVLSVGAECWGGYIGTMRARGAHVACTCRAGGVRGVVHVHATCTTCARTTFNLRARGVHVSCTWRVCRARAVHMSCTCLARSCTGFSETGVRALRLRGCVAFRWLSVCGCCWLGLGGWVGHTNAPFSRLSSPAAPPYALLPPV